MSAMKSVTLEVRGLFGELDHLGVEKRIGAMPGVHHAQANSASGSITVQYDAGATSEEALRQAILECGYHCSGEVLPRHVCKPAALPAQAGHAGHAAQPGAKDEMAH